ncbi:unnamed protein product [Caenorhabditis sp. 36 PRJEB53466]|nr:unnamed protein product [Caenorhabditis sp. 36 PRJEB53466]
MPPFSDEKPFDRSIARKVLIDQSKQQQISLISGFRGVARHLKSLLNVEINTEPITLNGLDDVRMLIIPQPKSSFGTGEIETIWKFVEEGGALMILSGEGGERQSLNKLIGKYGIIFHITSLKKQRPTDDNGVTNYNLQKATHDPPSGMKIVIETVRQLYNYLLEMIWPVPAPNSSFPLLKLPAVPLLECLRAFDEESIVEFAFISRSTKWLTRTVISPRYTEDRSIARKVLIDQSKQQQISLISGFRGVARHLKSLLNVEINTEPITLNGLDDVRMLIIPQPKSSFGTGEIETIWKFVEEGGALMILSGEGGERQSLNELIGKYGITVNKGSFFVSLLYVLGFSIPDAVIRTVFLKYFDPKEALVANGVVNRSIAVAAKKNVSTEQKQNAQALSFIYPYGCTLNVNSRLSTIVLSSGSTSFPISRPVAAFHETKLNEMKKKGRVCVIGSVSMFHDTYIDKEENGKIFDTFVEYLINGFDLNTIDSAEPEISDYTNIPDHIHMSQQVKVCMYEGELDSAVSSDFMKIMDNSLHSISLKQWPMTLRLYEALNLSPPPLTLVEPQFDLPMPPFQPAVFPPTFQELPMPPLELFDLDEQFSSPEIQLSQLANRSEEEDLVFFIEKAAEITGLSAELTKSERTPKKIMELALNKLILFKGSMMGGELEVASAFDIEEEEEGHNTSFNRVDEMDEQLYSDIDEFDDL